MEQWRGEGGRGEEMDEERKGGERMSQSDKRLFITTPYTPITESGHISVTKFGHAVVDLNTVVMYVNKHTQEIMAIKPTTNRQKPTLANVIYTHQATLADEGCLLSTHCPMITPTSSRAGMGAKLCSSITLKILPCVLLVTDV